MDTFTVRIIFYGLMAFVPNSDENPKALRVLLPAVGAQRFASDGCRIPEHLPAIYASGGGCQIEETECGLNPKLPLAKKDFGVIGSWPLDGVDLSIRTTFAGTDNVAPLELNALERHASHASSKIPSSYDDARGLSWVARLKRVYDEVNEECLSGSKPQCPITARILVTEGQVESCRLAMRKVGEDEGRYRICPFEFKALRPGSQEGKGTIEPSAQALSSVVRLTTTVPWSERVVIAMKPLDGEGKEQRIVLTPRDNEVTIWILNIMDTRKETHSCNHYYENSDEPAVDRHFELLYDLVQPDEDGRAAPYDARLVPHEVREGCVSGSRALEINPVDNKCAVLEFFDEGGFNPPEWSSCGGRFFSSKEVEVR